MSLSDAIRSRSEMPVVDEQQLSPAVSTRHRPFVHVDWGAIFASVVSGMGITVLLVLLVSAAGLVSGEDDPSTLGSILGWWTAASVVIGTFVGCLVGGRLSRWLSRPTTVFHALTSWGLATMITCVLALLLSASLLGNAASVAADTPQGEQAAASATAEQATAPGTRDAAVAPKDAPTAETTPATPSAEQTTDTIGKAGWAVGLGLLLSLVVAIAGWWLGSRTPLTRLEREDMITVR